MHKPDILELLSTPLYKMAIENLEPGEETDMDAGKDGTTTFDYSHMLPKGTGLQLFVTPGSHMIYTHVQDEDGNHVGNIQAHKGVDKDGKFFISPHSDLHEDFHGMGIGKAMYEALYAHCLHKLDIKEVEGGAHSEDAGRVHEALARKHGLKYRAKHIPKKMWQEDDGVSRGPYRYSLAQPSQPTVKSERTLQPALEKALPKTPQENEQNRSDIEAHMKLAQGLPPHSKCSCLHCVKWRAQNQSRLDTAFNNTTGQITHGTVLGNRPIDIPETAGNQSQVRHFGAKIGYGADGKAIPYNEPVGGPHWSNQRAEHEFWSKSEDLLFKDEANQFLSVSPETFEAAIAKHPDQSNLENPRDYEGKKTFLSPDGTHGYGLHGDELVNVFSLVPGGGSKAVRHALRQGARKLNCFDGHLPVFYSKFGFKEVKREPNWTAGGPDVVHMELSGLAKGLLGAALVAGTMAQAQPNYQLVNAFNRAQTVPAYVQQAPAKWSPNGLHNDLIPIAHLESSFGLNMLHAPNSKGDYHTAYGACGFKGSTAHEEWQKTKQLQKLYPGLEAPEAFMKKFKEDHQFYNTVASAHFARLKQRHGTPTKAAYAWRWGSNKADKATDADVANDDYVKKYHAMSLQTGIKPHIIPVVKAESLDKMAIKEIAPGKPDENGHFDYSHLLPDEFKNKLQLKIVPGRDWIHSSLYETPGMPPIGTASGYIRPNAIEPHSDLDMNFRGKGLGQAMYEALYAHAHHHLGIENVHGGPHTAAAGRVHEALSRKHGMSYTPTIHVDPDTGRQARDSYNYAIKSEDEEGLAKMAIRDLPPGTPEGTEGLDHKFDYTAHLPNHLREKGYRMRVTYNSRAKALTADVIGPLNNVVGFVESGLEPQSIAITNSNVENAHRGQKLGLHAYQAVITHAYNHHGAKYVVGDIHSTLAHKTHKDLAERHGMDYDADRIGKTKNSGARDEAFGEYEYRIK